MEYLDRAFDWAERTDWLLVELHIAPESQNGFDSGGMCGVCRFHHDPAHVEIALDVLQQLATRYADHPSSGYRGAQRARIARAMGAARRARPLSPRRHDPRAGGPSRFRPRSWTLDLGFLAESKKLVRECRADCQLALFSATIPPAVEALIQAAFHDPVVIRTEGSHKTVASLVTRNVNVVRGRRFDALQEILSKKQPGGTLVFANTRDQCDALVAQLRAAGHERLVYREEMDKVQRKKNLRAFRDGEVDLLVATDLGSRGLDIEQVARVVHDYLPESMQNYLHRVGRTARAGRSGLAIKLCHVTRSPAREPARGVRPHAESSRRS